jgi:TonB family protein
MSGGRERVPGNSHYPLTWTADCNTLSDMRCIHQIGWTSCLAALIVLSLLRAEDAAVDIQAAQAAKNPEALEKGAAWLESHFRYGAAQQYLEAALALRAQINGDQSADYGICLLSLGAIERKTGHAKEAAGHYDQALHLLPGRSETAPVFLYLGIAALGKKDFAQAAEHLQRAQALDTSLTGPAMMWTGLMRDRQDQVDGADAAFKSALAADAPDSLQAFEAATLYTQFLRRHGRDGEADTMQAQVEAAGKNITARPPTNTTPTGGTPRRPITPSAEVQKAGGAVTQPTLIHKVDPPYSEEARVAKYSASVLIQLVVGTDGAAQNLKVVKPAGFGLDDCALVTISQWKFKPGEKEGSPVPVSATVEVNFRLL